MSLVLPIFLAGAVLLVVPWLIHRIRRPERQEVPFSSLMFVPHVKKDVIERRKLQHLVLMLIRMLLFLLLVAAFSRPYWPKQMAAEVIEPAAAYHLILLDRSASMGVDGRMTRAKQVAAEIVRDLPADAAADIVIFDRATQSLGDGFTTTRGPLLAALNQAGHGMGQGDLLAAMQFAERRLLAAAEQVERAELTLHLISDFQKPPAGDPPRWKLSGQIQFRAEPVSSPWPPNLAIDEIAVRLDREERLIIAAKVKNWNSEPRDDVAVSLNVGGEVLSEKTVDLGPWSGAQVRFELDGEGRERWEGFVAVTDDGPSFDNRRYFVKPVPRATEIRLVRPADAATVRGDAWFLDKALRAAGDQRWRLETLTGGEISTLADDVADVVIVHDLPRLPADAVPVLTAVLARGGGLFLLLGPRADAASYQSLLDALGVELGNPAFAITSESTFALPSRVDLAHPLFRAFQGPQFNDFTSLRFHNFRALIVTEESQAAAYMQLPASDENQVMTAAGTHELGRWVIWPFTADLKWTNLAKHVKYLPMVHETLGYLAPPATPDLFLTTGESPDLRARTAGWPEPLRVTLPDGNEQTMDRDQLNALKLSTAGFLRVTADAEQELIAAVNVPAPESESAVQQPNEVALQWTTGGAVAESGDETVVTQAVQSTETTRDEFGWWLLPVLAAFFLIETLAAIALSRQPKVTTA